MTISQKSPEEERDKRQQESITNETFKGKVLFNIYNDGSVEQFVK